MTPMQVVRQIPEKEYSEKEYKVFKLSEVPDLKELARQMAELESDVHKDLHDLRETVREFKDDNNKIHVAIDAEELRLQAQISDLHDKVDRLESALEQLIPFVEEKRQTNEHLDKVLSEIEDALNQ